MLTVFNLQWLRLKREPFLAISFLAMTLVFVYFIVGSSGSETLTISTFSSELNESEMNEWVDRLNREDAYDFKIQKEEDIKKQIQGNRISFALELKEDGYQYLVGQESQFLMAVNQHVENIYRTHLRINEVNEQYPDNPVIQQNYVNVESRSLAGGVSGAEESSGHIIVGMTLYFSMFTTLFMMMNIATEKKIGTWDRLISSPLKKTSIYIGQLLHYFLIGFLQIIICFIIFNQIFHYDFGTNYLAIAVSIFAYVFALVSLGMLIISIVKSPQQLQAVIPIVCTGSAMLGGAFWPLEVVSNHIILFLAQITPIYFGMDALKKVIIFDKGVSDILTPISILLFMGVLFMGIGLNLMERKK